MARVIGANYGEILKVFNTVKKVDEKEQTVQDIIENV
jgi:hypothetical protein